VDPSGDGKDFLERKDDTRVSDRGWRPESQGVARSACCLRRDIFFEIRSGSVLPDFGLDIGPPHNAKL